jgi:tetratricopeptide (TPR) repeat protein
LTRQATATDEPAERLRLFEALGDMALATLHDEDRARTCYAAAVSAAAPLEAKHVPLLEKLLARQELCGDHAGSARTAELMAAFGATPAERAARHLRAARDYLTAGDVARARAAAERAVESDPYDIDAVDLASGLGIDHGEVDAAAAMLTRLLTARDDRRTQIAGGGDGSAGGVGVLPRGIDRVAQPADVERRAALSYRLGHARAQRGDVRQAVAAYESAIAIAPAGDGALHARRGLVDLLRASDDPARREGIAIQLQAITATTGALVDLVAWADELRRQNLVDAAYATLELALACGHAADVHQRAFLSIHTAHTLRDDEPYKAALDGHRALVSDLDEAPFAAVAVALSEAAALVWPDLDDALTRNDAASARRIPASVHAPATAMFPRIATALGAGAVMLYERDAGREVAVVCGATPVIVLGSRMLAPATPTSEIRAVLARAVELTRPEHVALAGLAPADATRLLASVVRLFGPPLLRDAAGPLVADPDVQRGHDDMVKAALPVKLRARLDQLLAALPVAALDVARYAAACERSADRAALLLGGDPRVLVDHVTARGERCGHLISAIAQPAWLPLRVRLGIGVR